MTKSELKKEVIKNIAKVDLSKDELILINELTAKLSFGKKSTKITRKQQYLEAIAKIEEAKAILRTISRENQNDYDSDRYAYELGQILSCDHGEAGLKPFVNSLN